MTLSLKLEIGISIGRVTEQKMRQVRLKKMHVVKKSSQVKTREMH